MQGKVGQDGQRDDIGFGDIQKMRNYFTLQIFLVMAKIVTNVLEVVEIVTVEHK